MESSIWKPMKRQAKSKRKAQKLTLKKRKRNFELNQKINKRLKGTIFSSFKVQNTVNFTVGSE